MRIPVALFCLFALACASSPPAQPTRYLLPAEAPKGTVRLDPPVQVGLLPLRVAPYLAQSGLVVETEAGQVRAARQHVWAEPLDGSLRRLLRGQISQNLGFDVSADDSQRHRWEYSVELGIDRFHGTLDGEAVLVARWNVTGPGAPGAVESYQFSASRALAQAGYRGLADALIALASQLSAAVADSLENVAPSTSAGE